MNNGVYVYCTLTTILYGLLFYNYNKVDTVVLDVRQLNIAITFYLLSMMTLWIVMIAMQLQANSVMRKVT